MIITRDEIKKKGIQELLELINSKEEIVILSKEKEDYYKQIHNEALEDIKSGKFTDLGDPKTHVEAVLQELSHEH